MPRDASGNTQPLPGTIVATGDTVLPSQHNPMVVDVYAMMTQSLSRDGQGGMRANLDFSTFKGINLAAGTAAGDAVNFSQISVMDPLGIPKPFLGAAAPVGYILCFGQAISRTTYAALFAVLGVTYGAGNGTTTFNVPDLRGRVLAGVDNMGGVAANRLTGPVVGSVGGARGDVGGEQSHVITLAEMTAHNHGGATGTDGFHTHTMQALMGNGGGGGGLEAADPTVNENPTSRVSTNGSGSHSHTIPTQGSSNAHNNIQPTIVVNYILRTGV